MIKLFVFDMDGVLIKIKENCYASKLFQDLYGIPQDEFYDVLKKNKFLERTKDDGSTFKLFSELLKKYKVKITEKIFWNIWFNNFKVKQDLVDFALSLKKSGKKIGILSDQFFERAEYLKDNLDWMKEFDCVLFSSDFGVTKHDKKFFKILIEKAKLKPEEIFFTDDDEKNVEVARSVGIKGINFTNWVWDKNNLHTPKLAKK
ncbi:MAG: hypothetical protein COY38_04775 [Candidatus Aenigmarchaeota archaeon CG_4_10_14_0_8_um_filter_37_24]|nr:HAD-IA family hydrolase [Candidatus Aenigmarchaeota archaeon]OIN86722.1 MAG: hypothetical protein AUJ50_03440 [Candidatus Aenigmarchaeota archaeon CG1_02_38_14]PIV68614.1 MAG: hypothetical protein COS07_03490 [Candidatus Aenigmarchaeota archaeon CG01_land_8_20_14_3_00_37_9]PIY35637.1 MAG: hypothetical protein COZ04_02785 [Candidatus Aenigmarchaeota archaeon CG_4_10_14_3_um_filter_37_21]PIZ33967.1 MAG: hypothetical protein COY38_04775 [Candidatus Aenigmarchaeota archaeon CG_4_10_14_0_8_um_fil